MEKSHRDQAARFGEQAGECLEQAQKSQTADEKAIWSEKADGYQVEARKALMIVEKYAWSKQVEQSEFSPVDCIHAVSPFVTLHVIRCSCACPPVQNRLRSPVARRLPTELGRVLIPGPFRRPGFPD